MTNHYHLLFYCNEDNLSEGMKFFSQNYAYHINKFTNGSGPVFTHRFQSKYIPNESYLLQVLRYIHLNPCQAGLGSKLSDYRWSSYLHYLNKNKLADVLEIDYFLKKFISLADFENFHEMGNSREIESFYQNQRTSQTLKLNL